MKKKQKTKRIRMTLDKLALMVNRGFNEVYDRMDKRFVSIEGRLDKIEIKLDSLERRIFAIENILTEHGKDIKEMKGDIKEIKAELKILKKVDNDNSEKILELEQRARALEVKVG